MADEPVSLEQVRDHLRLSASQTADDNYLGSLITTARRSVERDIEAKIVGAEPTIDEDDLPVIREVILLLVAHWFWNREATTTESVKDLPLGIGWLLWPLKTVRI